MNMVDILTIFVPVAGVLTVAFAVYLARDVLSRDTGTKEMQDVAAAIVEGATAFLRRQYRTIAALALVTAVLVGVLLAVIPQSNAGTRVDQITVTRGKVSNELAPAEELKKVFQSLGVGDRTRVVLYGDFDTLIWPTLIV